MVAGKGGGGRVERADPPPLKPGRQGVERVARAAFLRLPVRMEMLFIVLSTLYNSRDSRST